MYKSGALYVASLDSPGRALLIPPIRNARRECFEHVRNMLDTMLPKCFKNASEMLPQRFADDVETTSNMVP